MAEERAQRRLAAILAADVVGYGRLMEQDEAGTLAALKTRRSQVLQPVVSRHRGRIVKLMGDGVLIEFASAVDAVECAVQLQEAMATANAGLPEERRIILRIGVNLGDVIVEGSDLYGDGVNIAARLEALAESGAVLVSQTVFSHVRGKVQLGFDDLGEQRLKNIAEPIRVYRVNSASPSVPPDISGKVTAAPKPTIAVLPFANLSGDPAQGYFSDGITEDIITDLSRWHDLAVQSRSASFRYRGTAADLGRIARELNVRYIVEGSVRRLGERIRITAQLIDIETGNHIWAERFDREIAELFTVQDEVVRTIVSTLVGRVHAADAERARRKPPASLAAYECVARGNALTWDDVKGAAEATRLFEKAIEIDPDYGYAHALLAVMRWRQWYNDLSGSDAALNEAYELAMRAVQLASNQSTCFINLSWICLLRRSFDLALQHMQRAIEINPTNQWNTASAGNILSYVGRAEEAIDWLKRAKQVDPYFNPGWYWNSLGQAHMVLRHYEEAAAEFERAPARPFWISAYLAGSHARMAATSRVGVHVTECLKIKPDFTIGRWMVKEPFKDPADAAHLVECLRAAGFSE
jgi:adenylate cyclase